MIIREQFPDLDMKGITKEKILTDYLKLKGVDEIGEYLNPTGKYLDEPQGYTNINKAYECLLKYQEKDFLLLIDCDPDGILSSSIINDFCMNHLKMKPHLLIHDGKQHGLSEGIMKKIEQDPVALLIIPDASSNDTDQCKILKNKGLVKDIIILDHHEIERDNPYAIVVNNKHKDNQNINNIELSGAGVTFKFIQYFCNQNGIKVPYYTDLVSFTLVSDMCNLTYQENRTFLNFGLVDIDNTCLHEFYKAYLKNYPQQPVRPEDIAWMIAPKINALCRFGSRELKEEVIKGFLGIKEPKYNEMFHALDTLHSKQANEKSKVVEKLKDKIETNDKIIVLTDEICVPELRGLVANEIRSKTAKLVFYVHKNGDNYIGSVRSGVPIKTTLNESGLVNWAQGHEPAHGISFPVKNKEKIIQFANSLDLPNALVYDVVKDFQSGEEISSELFYFGDNNQSLWGKGIEYPLFCIHDIFINGTDISVLGSKKTTVKFKVDGLTYIMHKLSHKIIKEEMFVGVNKNMIWTIVGKLNFNEFMGNVTPQMQIVDFEVKEGSAGNVW